MKNISRYLLAQYRDFLILLREIKWSLLAFTLVNLIGGLFLYKFYTLEQLSLVKAIYAVYNMIFFQTSLPFPKEWYLQLFFFLVPLLGLGVIVEGFARFGMLVINKSSRGEAWYKVLAGTYENHIIVCGIGHVGFRIIEELKKLGEEIVAVEKERDGPFVETLLKLGTPILFGNAQDEALLETAGLKKAKTIIIATDNDLANIEIALNARISSPSIRIVLRLFDARLAAKVQARTQVDMAFSTSALAAPVAASAAVEKGVLHSFYVGDKLMNVTERVIEQGSSWKGQTITEIEQQYDFTVVMHQRNGIADHHPPGSITLEENDRLVILVSLATLAKLSKVS